MGWETRTALGLSIGCNNKRSSAMDESCEDGGDLEVEMLTVTTAIDEYFKLLKMKRKAKI